MNRGEVWAVTHEDGTTRRVAIVSGGAWNQGAQPQAVAVIDDRDAFEVPPFLVAAEGEPRLDHWFPLGHGVRRPVQPQRRRRMGTDRHPHRCHPHQGQHGPAAALRAVGTETERLLDSGITLEPTERTE